MSYSYILFDVAGTLIYKKDLYETIAGCIRAYGMNIPVNTVKMIHTTLVTCVDVPDSPSRDFYKNFNELLLLGLGVIPEKELCESIYFSCKKISWTAFNDTTSLESLLIPKGVLSNFDNNLHQIISSLLPSKFDIIVGSQQAELRKPDERFFMYVLDKINRKPNEVLYIGDSIKLDYIPARNLGMHAVLLDRTHEYPWFNGDKISSLNELINTL